ncbi:unnamed protein product [Rotaria sp. Silwood2]|nr:unnamed protein product [Rotaria sp. Silwood2]CAF3268226.1 unnamed protein product [Rotaria sp. Silwood2]CAF4166308.1 unnamed protein product [Rotaria sp. Silwood2]CAF4405774.1 unnamed protein product [Rotaria sp. Silwood2]
MRTISIVIGFVRTQVYYLNETEVKPQLLYVFPNNQQQLKPMNLQQLPHRIVNLVVWNSQIVGLVLDAPSVLLIPSSPPGHCSALIEEYDDIAVYKPKPCMPGTHQVNRSFGPCVICPPGWKNDGSAGEICVRCATNHTSWCFGAAIHEIDVTNITSYDQANPYPESPYATEFDDILLQNIFQLSIITVHCLLLSPIFWTCVAIGGSLIIFIIIKILSCRSKSKKTQRFLEKILSHCDVIGEGKYWLGGLISLSLLVLIIFACKFSISFSYLYPIEETSLNERQGVSCDDSLFNAKLTSSLQLLSTLKHEDEKPIFDLLSKQNITMTVQFISTDYTCKNVSLLQIRDRGLHIPSTNFSCSETKKILTISKLLPQHIINLKLTLNGPYFIGGLRLCFSAPSATNISAHSKVQQMDTCQFFFTPNQTLTRNPTVNIKMTKVINQTASLMISNNTTYTGLWLPSFIVDTLTDELLFSLDAEYLRYVPDKTILVVVITESEFYMKNTQEPIARHYEIIFSTILFASKILVVMDRRVEIHMCTYSF